MTCDSGRPPQGENSRSEVECEAGQSGAERASPMTNRKGSSTMTDAKVELVANALYDARKCQCENGDRPTDWKDLARAAITALEQSDAVMGEEQDTGCPPHCCCCDHYEPCCDCGEIMPSKACIGEKCWCGAPAAKKVGEEILFDDPIPARHNLTRYICARHYAQLMGTLGAKQVGLEQTSHD